MDTAKVTVIIPAYNQAQYLGEAIQSVLTQTFSDFELIIVDDGSTDSTASIVTQYKDPRIHYIYQVNKGLPGARNTGIIQSNGQYIAFLDSDDLYHPEKLAIQVALLDRNPEVGLCFSSRIEIDQDGKYLWLVRVPDRVSLVDLVLGFPFTINDLLVRRDWVQKVEGFDETFVLNSEDRDFYIRLVLSGCNFSGIDRCLSFRRRYNMRKFKKLDEKLSVMLRALDTASNDNHCPNSIRDVLPRAKANVYLDWAFQEFFQGETSSGQMHLRESLRLNPSILSNQGKTFLETIVFTCIRIGEDHEGLLKDFFNQFPAELSWITKYQDWCIARGYVIRGARELIWRNNEEGSGYFRLASDFGVDLDDPFLFILADQLLGCEIEFKPPQGDEIYRKLANGLKIADPRSKIRLFKAYYHLNLAFDEYQKGCHKKVPFRIISAILYNPSYLVNRGTIKVLGLSILRNLFSLVGFYDQGKS